MPAASWAPTSRFRFVEEDIRDGRLLRDGIGRDTLVVHLAVRAGVRPSVEDPELYASVNVGGSVMDGVPRFVRSYEDTHGRQT